MGEIQNISRRGFLALSAAGGAGLVLAVSCRARSRPARAFAPNAFIQIEPSGDVTIWVSRAEMGQGVHTALPMIVAEELEADFARVRIEQAVADPKYGRMRTGGSTSVRRLWEPLRQAGATAREMLIAAAARRWHVPPESCRASQGMVLHDAGDRRASYGELVDDAARVPVPVNPRLKDVSDFRLIGTRIPRLDIAAKVDGSAVFGMDARTPGMLTAVVARCPVLGGKVASFDAERARSLPGVRHVVQIPAGIAVVADRTWPAMKGREALDIRWDEGPHAHLDSAEIRQMLHRQAGQPGVVAQREGEGEAALEAASRVQEASYEVPFLAHATMEPMNALAHAGDRACELWLPTQAPQEAQEAVAQALGLHPSRVTVHTTLIGGGFGRRLQVDYAVEAALVSRAVGEPVKVVWTREDDMQHDFYRPASVHRLRGSLDGSGALSCWVHRVAAPSRGPERVKNGLDESALEGAIKVPYTVPNIQIEFVLSNTPVPAGSWRGVYHTQNAFAGECFVDELAHAAGADPYRFRQTLLARSPRHARVLDLAAERAGWGEPLSPGRGRGIAVHESFETCVAQVVEVEVDTAGSVQVVRVVSAVDCGLVVHPDAAEAQIEGAVIFALGAALRGAITIERGRVRESNFDGFSPLRLPETPAIEVYFVPSNAPPGGIGEPGVPPLAPALANAVFAAIGKRVRRLPLVPELARRE